jgi:hypothetical protein
VRPRQELGVDLRPPAAIIPAAFDREPPSNCMLCLTPVENDFDGVVVGKSFHEIRIEFGNTAGQDE